jgi:hypothetical protein
MLRVFFAAFLMSCGQENVEQPRKEMLQSLIKQLGDDSSEKRDSAYLDLRDVYIRKRDIPYLKEKINQNPDASIAVFLRELITYIEQRWRLPDKGWTSDRDDLYSPYYEKSQTLGSIVFVHDNLRNRNIPVIFMEVYFPDNPENIREIENLILSLEPETLSLIGEWKDITFLKQVINLQELSLDNTNVNDLSPLKDLNNLVILDIKDEKLYDFRPLKEIPNLRLLYLDSANGSDLNCLTDTVIQIIFNN